MEEAERDEDGVVLVSISVVEIGSELGVAVEINGEPDS